MKIELDSMEISSEVLLLTKANKLCRVCLADAGERSTSLFEMRDSVTILDKIMLCTRVLVRRENDCFPNLICQRCSAELEVADKFRRKCEYSDNLLTKLFQSPMPHIKDEFDQLHLDIKDGVDLDIKDGVDLDIKESEHSDSKINDYAAFDSVSIGSNRSLSDHEVLSSLSMKKQLKKQKKLLKAKRKKKHRVKDEIDDNVSLSECIPSLKIKTESFETCCHICNQLLKSKNQLLKHLKSLHGEEDKSVSVSGARRRYNCTECSYSTPRRQTLLYHTRIHTGEKPYQCNECDRRFAQPSSLSSHLKSHSDKMYFTCPQCGKQFKHKEKYERHKSVHSDVTKFICTICNKGLKSQDTLRSHMNRHYNIRNFSCETCGSSFVTRIELLNHAKKHSDEKKFQCTICDFRTRLKQILDKHMKRHTGNRSFKCEHCVYTCYDRGELKFHMRKHTREKKYSCPVCQRFFIHSSSVNKHMFKIHGMQYRVNDSVDRRIVK